MRRESKDWLPLFLIQLLHSHADGFASPSHTRQLNNRRSDRRLGHCGLTQTNPSFTSPHQPHGPYTSRTSRAPMRLTKRCTSCGSTSLATDGSNGIRSLTSCCCLASCCGVTGPVAATSATLCPRVRKLMILVMLSTTMRSSGVTFGASGSIERRAPGSSTGSMTECRPRRSTSRNSWSRLSASTLLTSSSMTNSRNHVP
mmetsp:Transcript_9202/g.28012  ORF Transcript_9202/g.28012 Transcript_9202/m.28012 type:complete len:200 (+) Transcript_9202:35-634(+)